MARSVSVPYGAVRVAYASFDAEETDCFDEAVDNFRYAMRSRYRSLEPCSKWIGREDRAVLENDNVYVTVSEYCGLVAVAVVPKGEGLAAASGSKMDLSPVEYFGTRLVKRGTFSNGEAIFGAFKPDEQKGAMGLGFSSKEGWL